MSERSSLYLWSVVPPADTEMKLAAVRQEFAINFDSHEALKRPVHLTLFTPFKLDDGMTEHELTQYRNWISQQPIFSITLKNFGFFEAARVVYVAVAENAALKELNSGITKLTKKIFELDARKSEAYHPHFTIGFRDLSEAVFPDVKQAYCKRLFSAAFPVDKVRLFRHDGKAWVLFHDFPLGVNQVLQQGLF